MKIHAVLFSPTHGCRKIAEIVTQTLKSNLQAEKVTHFDLTLPGGRTGSAPLIEADDLLVLALPVYGGRIPQIMLTSLCKLKGNGAKAIVIAVYGNRAYEDALLEMKDLLTTQGFAVVAAAAFIGEHSLSRRLAAGRPDSDDMVLAREFAEKAAAKLAAQNYTVPIVPGNTPYRDYSPAVNLAPHTTDSCYNCMLCVYNCPAGAISLEDPKVVDGAECLRCCACVKGCPVEAKLFNVPSFMEKIKAMEENFIKPKAPEMFL